MTSTPPPALSSVETLTPHPPASLPRILCLHGGGTSATIFRIQTRHLARALSPHFRLIYLDAPFPSDAGPGVLPVFVDCGPYHRWMPVEDYHHHSTTSIEAGVAEQVAAARTTRERIVACIRADEEREMEKSGGGVEPCGDVVGVLGFSQGARMAAGLLADQAAAAEQQQQRNGGTGALAAAAAAAAARGGGMPDWKFGVLLCGSHPPYSVANAGKRPDEDGGRVVRDEHGVVEPPGEGQVMRGPPTVHVRGLVDPHLEKGRRLERYFAGEKEVMEFEMGHHLPQAAGDVASGGKNATNEIRDAILRAWRRSQGEGVVN